MAKTITLLWDGPDSLATATVTGGSGYLFDGGAASFPEALDASSVVTVAADGDHVVTVDWRGTEIFSKTVTFNGAQSVVLNVSPTVQQQLDIAHPDTSTTTDLADIDAAVNTAGKYAGKVVFNTTTGLLLVADGGDADSTWSTAAGVATHTPA